MDFRKTVIRSKGWLFAAAIALGLAGTAPGIAEAAPLAPASALTDPAQPGIVLAQFGHHHQHRHHGWGGHHHHHHGWRPGWGHHHHHGWRPGWGHHHHQHHGWGGHHHHHHGHHHH